MLEAWRAIGRHGSAARQSWTERLDTAPQKARFEAALSGDISAAVATAIEKMKQELSANPQKVASRVASQKTIEALVAETDSLFGGSADLTGSNNTKAADQDIYSAQNPAGHYIHYGVREHGMAAAMNGIALHGGAIPYGGTFLVFTDYCRPSIRLSALMEQRAIYVMTHDSIGLGEDGPTHQPVEHFAALRAIPNLNLFRPADIIETAEAWQIGLNSKNTPSVLALSRQGLPQLRLGDDIMECKSARGGYILREASSDAEIVLMATGSEVMIADEARTQLEAQGRPTRLVSVPCLDLLLAQDAEYRQSLIGAAKSVVVVEAGIEMGWASVAGPDFSFIGMNSFGASAPAADLFQHFGITAQAVIDAALAEIS